MLKRWEARRVVIVVIGLALLLCCGGTLIWYTVDSGLRASGALPTYTPSPTNAPRPTATERPSATPEPTNTPLPPTVVATVTPAPTDVPVRVAPVIVAPSAEKSSCDCAANTMNCDDFEAWDAQACYLRCLELTGSDVHDLDRDGDGNACEWDG